MFIEKIRAIRAESVANRKIPIYRSTVPRIKGNHNAVLVVTCAAIVLGALNISAARADIVTVDEPTIFLAQSSKPQKGGGENRPPREAMEACADAKVKQACSFNGRGGEVVKGTCLSPKADVPLACVPANQPKKG
ncbi:MAG: hypothetical protein V7661_05120 [Sulfitobacter sp.]